MSIKRVLFIFSGRFVGFFFRRVKSLYYNLACKGTRKKIHMCCTLIKLQPKNIIATCRLC